VPMLEEWRTTKRGAGGSMRSPLGRLASVVALRKHPR